MKNYFFIVAYFTFFLSVSVHAQLLWKISGNGLSKPSYLFGTHHLVEKNQIKDFDKILAFIPQTDAVVGEMDMSNMFSMELKLLRVAMMKDTAMHDLLSPADYGLVDNELKQVIGKGLDKLGKLKPVMLSTIYEAKLYMNQNQLKKEPEAVDVVFQKVGKKNRKEIIGLETVEQQIDILVNSTSLKQQAEDLVSTIKQKDEIAINLKKVSAAYISGNLVKLDSLFNEQPMPEEEKKVLVIDRNNRWIERLMGILPQKSCFIAVGCLHLVNKYGMIELLKAKGFTVEPVKL